MNAGVATERDPRFIFEWDAERRRSWRIVGFLVASLALHALCFYIFQIIYPPAVALLPAPGRVNLIAPNSDDGRVLLRWLDAEDPALASTTQPPPSAKVLTLPVIRHAPSYLTRQPALKELPSTDSALTVPNAQPPAPVPMQAPGKANATTPIPTSFRFSTELHSENFPATPPFKFTASRREPPEATRFRVAINARGEVRYCFLESSSGDPILDQQAQHYLSLSRLAANSEPSAHAESPYSWASVTVEWGDDVIFPSSPAENVAP